MQASPSLSLPVSAGAAWLEWPGWDGVAGVVSLIALVVAGVVAAVELRSWFLTSNSASIEVRLRTSGIVDQDGQTDVNAAIRATAATALYDVEVLVVSGHAFTEIHARRPVLEVRDRPIEVKFSVRAKSGDGDPTYLAVTWEESTRLGPRAAGYRVRLDGARGRITEWWVPYGWPFWPRKTPGRWRDRRRFGTYLPIDAEAKRRPR